MLTRISRIFFSSTLICLFLLLPGWARESESSLSGPKPQGYAKFWIDKDATASEKAVQETLADLAGQGKEFTHILVMTHGFDLNEAGSTKNLEWLAAKFRHQFSSKGAQKLGLVGLQWNSDTGAVLMPLGSAYLRKVSLARSAGRGPARQLLLALKAKYPKAHISLVSHSLGGELMAAALTPELVYDGTLPFVAAFQPKSELTVLMQAFIGSDGAYDIYYKGQVSARQTLGRAQVFYQTMVPVQPKARDKVLAMKAHFFDRPLGNRYPRLSQEQLDFGVSQRRWLIDSQEIPDTHNFTDYFSEVRVARLADTMKFLANAKAPKPELIVEAEKVLSLPAEVKALTPYLEGENAGATLYALWKLEKKAEGNSIHLCDETYARLIDMLREHAQQIWREQKKTSCRVIKDGIFPTEAMMAKAGAPAWARPNKWK